MSFLRRHRQLPTPRPLPNTPPAPAPSANLTANQRFNRASIQEINDTLADRNMSKSRLADLLGISLSEITGTLYPFSTKLTPDTAGHIMAVIAINAPPVTGWETANKEQ